MGLGLLPGSLGSERPRSFADGISSVEVFSRLLNTEYSKQWVEHSNDLLPLLTNRTRLGHSGD